MVSAMFSVNDNCLKCGLCSELCPARIIKFEKGDFPAVAPEKEERCIKCGHCACFCPNGAAHLSFQAEEERLPIQADAIPKGEAAEMFLRSRRSIRRFKDQSLDDELVNRILESVRFAPSASNSQPVRWLVTRKRETLLKLGLMTADHFINRPSGDEATQEHLAAVAAAQLNGRDVIFLGAPHLALAVVKKSTRYAEDAAIALTYFEMAAHALGVGCCWAGYFTLAARACPALRDSLNLKPDELVVGGQMFGWPKEPSLAKILPPRKKIDLTWL